MQGLALLKLFVWTLESGEWALLSLLKIRVPAPVLARQQKQKIRILHGSCQVFFSARQPFYFALSHFERRETLESDKLKTAEVLNCFFSFRKKSAATGFWRHFFHFNAIMPAKGILSKFKILKYRNTDLKYGGSKIQKVRVLDRFKSQNSELAHL